MLAAFLEEAEGLIQKSDEKSGSAEAKIAETQGGTPLEHKVATAERCKLLIAACNDWDNMTSKDAVGLDDPHEIVLFDQETAEQENVLSTFSSSVSQHMFILTHSGNVYALGKNDSGQCGNGADTEQTSKSAGSGAGAKASSGKGKEKSSATSTVASATNHWPSLVALPFNSSVLSSRQSVSKISTGKAHSVLLTTQGSLWACGSNECGQCGLGNSAKLPTSFKTFQLVQFPVAGSSSSEIIIDCACGHDFSVACTSRGALYSWGHPESGQLGHGTTGEYIRDGGKGAAVQYDHVFLPKLVVKYVQKDSHGKLTATYTAADINIVKVACGKNHTICLESWEEVPGQPQRNCNRMFSFGFGGYGRLGHGSGITSDETVPREIMTFSQSGASHASVKPTNLQRQMRSIVCGSSFTLAVSATGLLYHWGKMQSAKGGESTMYPKILPDTQSMPCGPRLAAGNNCVIVGFNDCAVAWGAPPAGKYGLEGGARSTTTPKYVAAIDDLHVCDVSAGYGHVCYVVKQRSGAQVPGQLDASAASAKFDSFPLLPNPNPTPAASSAGSGKRKRAE